MNNSVQAANGLKTFLVTLVISLTVFGTIYFAIVSGSKEQNIGSTDTLGVTSTDNSRQTEDKKVAGVTLGADTGTKKGTEDSKTQASVFEEISKNKSLVEKKAVLGGATYSGGQSTTTPATGTSEITFSLIVSTFILAGAGLYMVYGPRRAALARFERDSIK